jgi:NACalpha-BTF3-like transcription factor
MEQAQSKALDSVTDYHEEKEIDSSKAVAAMTRMDKTDEADAQKRAAREAELAAVVVSEEQVQLLMRELEMPRTRVDRALREHKNDVAATIRALLRA